MRRQQTPSVSLFPFLAVLVCAMGALILLLLVTTRRIRSSVVLQARVAQVQPEGDVIAAVELIPQAPTPIESTPIIRPTVNEPVLLPLQLAEVDQVRLNVPVPIHPVPAAKPRPNPNHEFMTAIQQLEVERERLHSELAAQARGVAVQEKRMADHNEQLQRTSAETAKIHRLRELAASQVKQLAADEAAVIARINELRGAIQNATVSAAVETKFTIAPYDGRSGTARRPILVECTGQGFRFIPEDVFISESDLRGFSAEFNPLLVGARTLVDHWTTSEESDEPYVLLIVRPSGSLAFYSAKKLLQNLGQPFGYELLAEEIKVDEPDVDLVARSQLSSAVQRAISERQHLLETLQAPALTRFGESVRDTEPDATRPGRAMRIGRNGSVHIDEPGASSNRSGDHGGSKFDGPFVGRDGGIVPGGRGAGNGIFVADNRPGTEGQIENRGANPFAQHKPGQPVTNAMGGIGSASTGRIGEHDGGGGTAKSSGTATGAGTNTGLDSGVFLKPVPNTQSAKSSSPLSLPGSDAGSGPPDPTKPQTGSIGSMNDQRRMAGDKTRQGRSDGSDPPSGLPGSSGSAMADVIGSAGPLPDFTPRRASSPRGLQRQGTRSQPPNRSPFSGSKRAWGVEGQTGSIGFERVIRITVDSESVRIGDKVIRVEDRTDSADLTLRVLTEINDHAKTWGQPSRGFYWVPALQFDVAADGDGVYRRVSSPLRSMGLTVEQVADSGRRGIR